MIIRILYCFIILILFSCVASPRYSSSTHKNTPEKHNSTPLKKSTVKQGEVLRGVSSWYGPNFHGKLTANGEVYDQYGLTAAHRTLPLNTVVRVTNLDNGKKLILRINDRGPFVDEHKRILDCSYGAAKKLGFLKKGIAEIKIDIIEFGDNKYMSHN